MGKEEQKWATLIFSRVSGFGKLEKGTEKRFLCVFSLLPLSTFVFLPGFLPPPSEDIDSISHAYQNQAPVNLMAGR